MFDGLPPKESPVITNEEDQTGKRQQPDVTYFYSTHLYQHLYHLLSQAFSPTLIIHSKDVLLKILSECELITFVKY